MIHKAGPLRYAWPFLFLLSGCGYVGDPMPPLANIPMRIQDVAAVQRGSRLIVQFTPPTTTTENMAVPKPLSLDLRVGTSVSPFSPDAWAAQAKSIPEVEVKNGMARYEIPSAEWSGKGVTLAARSIGPNGKDSGWSNFVTLDVVPAPVKPTGLRAEPVANGVRLTWQGSAARYHVFRRGPDEKEFKQVGTPDRAEWVDETAETGKAYTYLAQAIVPAGVKTAESELSDEYTVTIRDTFPPAAPTGVRTVSGTQSIELTWERNAEADLAGYRVYRAVGDGAFEKVGETSVLPSYSDRAVEAGKSYRYQVSAIDRSGNESERSAIATAGL